MEWLENGDLLNFVQNKSISLPKKVKIFRDITNGMAYMERNFNFNV